MELRGPFQRRREPNIGACNNLSCHSSRLEEIQTCSDFTTKIRQAFQVDFHILPQPIPFRWHLNMLSPEIVAILVIVLTSLLSSLHLRRSIWLNSFPWLDTFAPYLDGKWSLAQCCQKRWSGRWRSSNWRNAAFSVAC
jgi:hypothetical protein